MRIGIDLRRINDTGIGRWAKNLTNAVIAENAEDEIVLILGRAEDMSLVSGNNPRVRCLISPARRYSLQELLGSLSIARRENLDLLHVPHQFHLALFGKWTTVVTIHDLTQLTHPPSSKARYLRWPYAKFLWLAARMCDAICTDSAAAKNSIVNILKVPAEKISVVEGAVDPLFSVERDEAVLESFRSRKGLPPIILLYVGMWKPHKNLLRLLEAFATLRREQKLDQPIGLVIVGATDSRNLEAMQSEIARLEISDSVHFPGKLADDELRLMYNLANVFVQPSLSEGFGLTLLEAMSCGTPVVASRIPPHEEIAGPGVLLVDPLSVKDIARGIGEVLADADLAQMLSSAGPAFVPKYSWSRAASRTLDIYRSVSLAS